MAQLGFTPAWYGWRYDIGAGNNNIVASSVLTMPEYGVCSSVSFFADADTGRTSVFSAMIWNLDGSVLWQSADAVLGGGSHVQGGQHWHTLTGPAVALRPGQQFRVGWWRTPGAGGSMVFSYANGGSSLAHVNAASRSIPGGGMAFGTIGAYINYTPGAAPMAVTTPATSITATSAVLNGMANDSGFSAAGGGPTSCDFNLGRTPALGTPVAASNPFFTVYDNGEHATVTGLTPNTTYYFQIATWNGWGVTYGPVLSFRTLTLPPAPSATTYGATSVTPTAATLNGSGNDNGLAASGGGPTDAAFNFGPTAAMGTVVAASVPSFTDGVNESAVVTGLTPDTQYYYQCTASNSIGSGAGEVMSFTTLAAPPSTDTGRWGTGF